ncbi:MAG TPA: hypothetical protein VFG42_24090 [Baekduia sp.]|uniref:hypothetical protein n=1 Tax=Baekduia sp. TaxID=2600305 RepID=UPI002D7A2C9D|nr:hypothetical protein [Baekduia sp.]HET6509895.1 hypothetical protein [Baekduia sp.]
MPTDDGWFAVRCVFRSERHDAERSVYEERITLWQAADLDAAIAVAAEEAQAYAEDTESEYAGLAQAYELFDEPGSGAEIFSLMRDSTLDADAYLDRFFDTGAERRRRS